MFVLFERTNPPSTFPWPPLLGFPSYLSLVVAEGQRVCGYGGVRCVGPWKLIAADDLGGVFTASFGPLERKGHTYPASRRQKRCVLREGLAGYIVG